jgi:GNAT superfamily N-acetyltransferase
VNIRRARAGDADAVTATITSAFHNDPVWSWAFPDEAARPAQFTRWWRLFVDAALRDGWVWVTDDCEAIAIWLEPGVEELNDDDIAQIWPLLSELLGTTQAAVVAEMLKRFDDAHPHEPPHYYLTFVATHTDQRGNGYGVQLLEHNLAIIDGARMPAYLESSNPRNEGRYGRLGFEVIGEFRAADDGPPLTRMWRPPSF